jgi:hypothetical protein
VAGLGDDTDVVDSFGGSIGCGATLRGLSSVDGFGGWFSALSSNLVPFDGWLKTV